MRKYIEDVRNAPVVRAAPMFVKVRQRHEQKVMRPGKTAKDRAKRQRNVNPD